MLLEDARRSNGNIGRAAIARKASPGTASNEVKAFVIVKAVESSMNLDVLEVERVVLARSGTRVKQVDPVDFRLWHNKSLFIDILSD